MTDKGKFVRDGLLSKANSMKGFYLYFSILFITSIGCAQNNIFFSHYMFNPSFYNPGSVGVDEVASVSFLYRNQWTGYRTSFDGAGGAPNTQLLSLIVPVKGIPLKGVGLNVSNDNLGPENNLDIQLSASYEFKLRFASLQLGVMPGLSTKTLNGNRLDPNDSEDPLIPNNRETQTKPNFGVGVYYKSNNGYFLGLGILNLIEPSFDYGYGGLNNTQKRSYSFHGGTSYKINKKITLMPTANVRTNLSGFTFDFGSILTYGDNLWTGLGYRLEESLIIYLGYKMMGGRLKAGYSFDYVVHNQDAKNPTSNEIYLKYDLPDLVFGGRKMVKTPRFTY